MYEVICHGKKLGVFDTQGEALKYIDRVQPYSTFWAMKYEGYSIEEVSK